MSIRTRIVWLIAIGHVTFFAAGILALWFDARIIALGFAIVTVCGVLLLQIRCPRCHSRLLVRSARFGGVRLPYSVPILPKNCPHCGLDLRVVPKVTTRTMTW